MAVSQRLRFEILRRDNHACRSCGRTPPEVRLHVDHVVPVALGGGDDPANLQTLCSDCNKGKSSVPADAPVVEDVASDAIRWAEAMKVVATERAAERAAQAELHDAFLFKWNSWTYDYRGERVTIEMPHDWQRSVDQFLAAGLEAEDLHALVDVAMQARTKDEWRYFCGCCWTQIRQAQARAAELLSTKTSTTLPTKAIETRWTDDEIRQFLSDEGFECEDHGDGKCPEDVLCRIVGVARLRELRYVDSVREWKHSLNDELICAEAEALIDG